MKFFILTLAFLSLSLKLFAKSEVRDCSFSEALSYSSIGLDCLYTVDKESMTECRESMIEFIDKNSSISCMIESDEGEEIHLTPGTIKAELKKLDPWFIPNEEGYTYCFPKLAQDLQMVDLSCSLLFDKDDVKDCADSINIFLNEHSPISCIATSDDGEYLLTDENLRKELEKAEAQF